MTAPDDGASPLALPAKPRILVVALRRLGDVLLTTPLIRSMRRAWPDATLDVLVFADTAGILEGNPDIDRIICDAGAADARAEPARRGAPVPSATTSRSPPRAAIARPPSRCWPGATHAGPVWPGNRIKRILLGRSVAAREGVHRVEEMLRIADALGIARVGEVVCPAGMPAPGCR